MIPPEVIDDLCPQRFRPPVRLELGEPSVVPRVVKGVWPCGVVVPHQQVDDWLEVFLRWLVEGRSGRLLDHGLELPQVLQPALRMLNEGATRTSTRSHAHMLTRSHAHT